MLAGGGAGMTGWAGTRAASSFGGGVAGVTGEGAFARLLPPSLGAGPGVGECERPRFLDRSEGVASPERGEDDSFFAGGDDSFFVFFSSGIGPGDRSPRPEPDDFFFSSCTSLRSCCADLTSSPPLSWRPSSTAPREPRRALSPPEGPVSSA